MSDQNQKSKLGKGLSSLLKMSGNSHEQSLRDVNVRKGKPRIYSGGNKNIDGGTITDDKVKEVSVVKIDKILPNPYQPRRQIDKEELRELSDSIKENGVVVPILLAKSGGSADKYVLVAGGRRLMAAKMAGLDEIPAVIVQDIQNKEIAQLALIENVQRKDLNPIDEGVAYLRLLEDFGLTYEEIAQKVGKSRGHIEGKVKLTFLPDLVKSSIILGEITEAHGRALASLGTPEAIIAAFKVVLRNKLTVKKTEELVREIKLQGSLPYKNFSYNRTVEWLSKNSQIREELSSLVGKEVTLKRHKKSGGSIIINFDNDEELIDIYRRLTGK